MDDAELPLTTRPAAAEDDAFVFDLFCEGHGAALAAAGLPGPVLATLLRGQFAGRRMTYGEQYPEAEHLVLLLGAERVGAAIVDRANDVITAVDLVVAGCRRGQGIGTVWLRGVLAEAREAGLTTRLSVAVDNTGARRLYERLGFVVVGTTAMHVEMECAP